MTQPPLDAPGWDEPLDDLDVQILDDIRAAWLEADPPPAMLVDQVRLALGLIDLNVEILAVTETRQPAAARSQGREDHVRRITFSNDDVTIMINVDHNPDDTLRMDGWLAPAGVYRVELRTIAGRRTTESNDNGRFVVDNVPRGLVQLVVHQLGDRPARTVATPTVEL